VSGSLDFISQGHPVSRPMHIDAEQAAVFTRWLEVLNECRVPYVVGGGYALYAFTGAWRDTKDLDVFLQPKDVQPALEALGAAGFETEVRDRLWLAKVHSPPYLLDLLFAIRHSKSLEVSDAWFQSCRPARLLGVPTCLLAPEELIATKVYLGNRDRFDGADIVHVIRALKGQIDWARIVDLLKGDDEIILWHLLLFNYVYPGHVDYLPVELMEQVYERVRAQWADPPDPRTFRGMLLDPVTFVTDLRLWGYRDSRDRTPLVDCDGRPV